MMIFVLKQKNFYALDVSVVTLSGQKILVALYVKQPKYIMKYQPYTNASKKIDDYGS